MNWNQIKGGWNRVNAEVDRVWGQIVDRDFTALPWKRTQLVSVRQQPSVNDKERAETEPNAMTYRQSSLSQQYSDME